MFAFFLAPLVTVSMLLLYLLVGPYLPTGGFVLADGSGPMEVLRVSLSCLMVAYFFEVILAVPIYMFLKHHKLDSVWSAAIVGSVLPALFLLSLENRVGVFEFALIALMCAPLGLVPALLFWALARPL